MTAPTGVTLRLASGPTLRGVRAVVFDCDGVLVDSESVWLDMLEDWHRSRALEPGGVERFAGLTARDTARRLLRSQGADPEDDTKLAHTTAELDTTYSSRLQRGVDPMPGAVELVTALSARVPVAVASNGRREDVGLMLSAVGILPRLSAVCTVEDVAHGKPSPDLYLAAAERLGTGPSECAAFEDSPAGSLAAEAAGMQVVGVNASSEVRLHGRHRLQTLTEITMDDEVPR